jgi:uncharacterized protein YunC (DUF1805 family)
MRVAVMTYKKIKIGTKYIEAFLVPLLAKNFIVLKGSKGYVMCGYLNLNTARICKDAAVKVVGVATIDEALAARVHSCTNAAKRLGVKKGQNIKETLRLIA